jgi:perosamine synthetase
VHLYGNLCQIDSLADIANRHELYLIEDAAEAIGSTWFGQKAGSIGDFGAFSFHGSKTMTTGEGGIFVTNSDRLYETVLTPSNHGRVRGDPKQFWASVLGFKYKMSNVQAAIGCGQLERIDELLAKKRANFLYYKGRLGHLPIAMNPEPVGTTNGYWMPTMVADAHCEFNRAELLAEFKKCDIDGRVFFWPLSKLPIFVERPQNMVSYGLYQRAINLPSYHDMSNQEQDRVINIIDAFFS